MDGTNLKNSLYATASVTNMEENSGFCILYANIMFYCAQHINICVMLHWGGAGWGNNVMVRKRHVLSHSTYIRHAIWGGAVDRVTKLCRQVIQKTGAPA